jgi:RNA-binding protein
LLNSKQRATLKGMANTMDTIVQVGKAGITHNVVKQTNEALTARELIKLRVLDGTPISAREAAEHLAEEVKAEVVQVIGTKFVLFRQNQKNPVIKI